MSRIIKGLPVSFLVTIKDDGTVVNINDGTWNTDVSLRYQTTSGPEPFALTATPAGNGCIVEISGAQTSQLDHKGLGYVIVVKASKIDETVNLRSVIQVSVDNDL